MFCSLTTFILPEALDKSRVSKKNQQKSISACTISIIFVVITLFTAYVNNNNVLYSDILFLLLRVFRVGQK